MATNIEKKEDTSLQPQRPRQEDRSRSSLGSPSFIDRFFEDGFFDPWQIFSPSSFRSGGLGRSMRAFPKVDVAETDKEIRITANIPGVDPDKVDIEVGDDYLSLSGTVEKELKDEDAEGRIHRYEREYGEFRREFSLPARVDKEGIVARAKNGVLTITLPKMRDERRGRIPVEIEK